MKHNQYTIEKGVPLPERKTRLGRPPVGSKYPFAEMSPLDSFFTRSATRTSLHITARFQGIPIVIAKATKNKQVGLRVWRVANEVVEA